MIKILLADDETDSRDAIVQYIDWEGHGLELVGAGELADPVAGVLRGATDQ